VWCLGVVCRRDEARRGLGGATAAETTSLTFDLTGVTFFGTTGVALLVATPRGRCQTLGIPVRLIPSQAVRNALRSCGVDRAFDVIDSPSDALAGTA
jgi:anti-anti-sigma regulatory factor